MRKFKEKGRPKLEIQAAVAELKVRKKALEQREAELSPKQEKFDRSGLEDLLKRRFFYTQSFAIYGGSYLLQVLSVSRISLFLLLGVAGLFDFGPIGCAMKSHLLALWRAHFVLEESMLEVDCSVLTPDHTLKWVEIVGVAYSL